jgi:hypothetical protein
VDARSRLLPALLGLALLGGSGAAEAQTCFGLAPTLSGAGKLVGTPGDDVILGSDLEDDIDGRGGADRICGLGGDDRIAAKKGAVSIDGGAGNDRIRVKAGAHAGGTVLGGAGDDVISFSAKGGAANSVDGGTGSDKCKAKGAAPVCENAKPCVAPAPETAACAAGACELLSVAGDPYAGTPGTFRGYADPHLLADPDVAGRVWLSYSWPRVETLLDGTGAPVSVAAVSNHLARSDDGGASFGFVGEPWAALPSVDPEGGSGENGLVASETASLAWLRRPDGELLWFGAHLRYFLRPVYGYNPNFATSYTTRVTVAATPEALGDAPETVLGVSATAAAWSPDLALDALIGLPLAQCAMANNPSLFVRDQTLYLIFECLAFQGAEFVPAQTTIQLVATEPSGDPASWTWRHVGRVADATTYAELGVSVLQQPDLSLGPAGELLLAVTPSREHPGHVERLHEGVRVLELVQLEPPVLARACDGSLRVRARLDTEGVGACTHSAASQTGLLRHSVQTATEPRHLPITGLQP